MTSCATTLHDERRNPPSLVTGRIHHGRALYHDAGDVAESQRHLPTGSSPISNRSNIQEMNRNNTGTTMSGSSTTIMVRPPLNMMTSTLLTSSSSDLDLATLARSHPSSQMVKDNGAELFATNVLRTTMNPQMQLLDIITEVLDLVSDEEDHLWDVLVERSNQEKLKDDPWSS